MKLVNYYYLLLLFGIVGCIAGVQQCYNDKEELITCDSTTGNAACFVDNNGKRGCANAGTATHTDNVSYLSSIFADIILFYFRSVKN